MSELILELIVELLCVVVTIGLIAIGVKILFGPVWKKETPDSKFKHYVCKNEKCSICEKQLNEAKMYKVPYWMIIDGNKFGKINYVNSKKYWDYCFKKHGYTMGRCNGLIVETETFLYYQWHFKKTEDEERGGDGTTAVCEDCIPLFMNDD